jgi:hypothetical protein
VNLSSAVMLPSPVTILPLPCMAPKRAYSDATNLTGQVAEIRLNLSRYASYSVNSYTMVPTMSLQEMFPWPVVIKLML